MTGKGLSAHAVSDVPEFGGGVAGSRHEAPGIRAEREAHHVSAVAREDGGLLTGLYVPQSTGETRVGPVSCGYAKLK